MSRDDGGSPPVSPEREGVAGIQHASPLKLHTNLSLTTCYRQFLLSLFPPSLSKIFDAGVMIANEDFTQQGRAVKVKTQTLH